MNLRRQLEARLSQALAAASGSAAPAMVVPSGRPAFGDYQANGVMPAAKALKTNPRKLAERVLAAADLSDLAQSAEVAGPGFINLRLRDDWIAARLAALADDQRLGAEPPQPARTVVIDYSHPNLAKEMHVGHLRSTIIGDALARVLEFLGHRVVRQNHVGDWGTQFGMLLSNMLRHERLASHELMELGAIAATEQVKSTELPDLEHHYQQAKRLFDTDPAFANESREYVVGLQLGEPAIRDVWARYRRISLQHCERVYKRLRVLLTPEDVRGESAYNEDLPNVLAELDKKGLLTESHGAKCVFMDEFTGKDGKPLPVIVQKSDGGYLYATTDLAAVRYRVNELGADRILYVVDARQSLHLRQVFAVARKAGFAPPGVSLEHVAFGMMLGPDGRPFKTREGGTVKLMDLLDEAESRARAVVLEKNPDLDEDRVKNIARIVGTGAVKYADLAQNRASDYVFSFEKMLSLEGNTAPYLQYAYARIASIFRKSVEGDARPPAAISLTEPAERALGLKLIQFPETVQVVADECLPNLLCGYLYDLAAAFTGFYESCPVLQSPPPLRASRLALCGLTARTLRQGLGLLGIETVEQM